MKIENIEKIIDIPPWIFESIPVGPNIWKDEDSLIAL